MVVTVHKGPVLISQHNFQQFPHIIFDRFGVGTATQKF